MKSRLNPSLFENLSNSSMRVLNRIDHLSCIMKFLWFFYLECFCINVSKGRKCFLMFCIHLYYALYVKCVFSEIKN